MNTPFLQFWNTPLPIPCKHDPKHLAPGVHRPPVPPAGEARQTVTEAIATITGSATTADEFCVGLVEVCQPLQPDSVVPMAAGFWSVWEDDTAGGYYVFFPPDRQSLCESFGGKVSQLVFPFMRIILHKFSA